MQAIERYPVDKSLAMLARALDLSPQRITRRAGLDDAFLTSGSRGVTTE
ncbi:hypothetical protein K1W69_01130 [Hoeflea sp. WL0058]|uniref:Uncharacterized protein n=1 Tax=Flavimaribacter sediminis TaxID=2865987 RepID=A0AAE2ZK41_9HYPH|nr:hypothetical protein [Flavimaribacter sediminis]MBW8635773.1 hypothetical protein [Flavimaribacter sediminis]